MSESALPLGEFESIEDLFVRPLREGLRPVSGAICSPADGALVQSNEAIDGQAIQVKGIGYSLRQLVFGDRPSEGFAPRWYSTVYLAPHNYHRVHAPCDGVIARITHFPGTLWPVNDWAVRHVPRLFNRNERLVFEIHLTGGYGSVFLVMVGALNVGRMAAVHWPGFVSNSFARQFSFSSQQTTLAITAPISRGQELGRFLLGSTVVLVFDAQAARSFRFVQTERSIPILMGQTLANRANHAE